MQIVFYILSISFQLGGAILGISSISTKREQVLRNFFKSSFTTLDGNTKEIRYNEDAYLEKWKSTYNNKFSFIYLAAGYCLSPLSNLDNQNNRHFTLLLTIIMTLILVFVEKWIVRILVRTDKIKSKVTYVELKKYDLDVDMESISFGDVGETLNND